MMLKYQRDWQSIVYLVALPALVLAQWQYGWNIVAYALLLFLTLGVGVIHHNHTHRRMWRNRWLNRATDMWISVLQGHPSFVFYPAHIQNHHRYRHGARDITRTYRFGGDHNHLLGYLFHPLQAVLVLYPLFIRWLRRLRQYWPAAYDYCLLQYAVVIISSIILASIDRQKYLLYILLPQLHGLHWLLATNYLQHAHADAHSSHNFARNFEGWVNPLLFNIGLHTAHHHHPRAHWSELTQLHRRYRSSLAPSMLCGGLLSYMLRTYLLSIIFRRFRSQTLMQHLPIGKQREN